MKGINWAGVIAALVVGEVIGFLWYGIVFEKQWVALMGITPNPDAAGPSMAIGLVNTLLIAVGLSWLTGKLGATTLVSGAMTGLAAGVFFAATAVAQNFIYGAANPGLVPIDFGYELVLYAAMGATLGAVKFGSKAAAAA